MWKSPKLGLVVLVGFMSGCFNPDRMRDPDMMEASTTSGSTPTSAPGSSGRLDTTGEPDDPMTTTGEPDPGDPDLLVDMGTSEDDILWREFLAARQGYLIGLAEPILECVDSAGEAQHPLFNMCVNWHGYAHATYALHVLYRLTGEDLYRQRADQLLPAAGLDQELAALVSGMTTVQIPYAHGWLLALAMERQRTTGMHDLDPLANEIAAQARQWLQTRTWAQLQAGVLSGTWDNIPWAVLNLSQWGQLNDDTELVAEMETFAADVLLSPSFDDQCSFNQDNDVVDGFFAPCLHRFMVAGAILPEAEVTEWLDTALAEDFEPVPLTELETDFQGGLNFSRAWGLWQLYLSTGDTAWRTRYVDHISTHMMMPQFWNDPANVYGFWVPQFGVYALALSADYEPDQG